MRAALVITGFLSCLLFLHIPVSSFKTQVHVTAGFLFTPADGQTSFKAPEPLSEKQAFFYRLPETDVSRFEVMRLSGGSVDRRFMVPPDGRLVNASGEEAPRPSGRGYLTAPDDGSYYLWYPRLGSYIYVFDNRGRFLWRKQESHYLQSFSHGRYIMAMAGDHSRVHFYKPSLEPLIDVEGHLAVRYQLSQQKEEPKKGGFMACIAFLGGDIVFIKNKAKGLKRLSTGHTLKSLSCDLQTGAFMAQVETSDNEEEQTRYVDSVLFGNVHEQEQGSNELNLVGQATLPGLYTQSLPLLLLPGFSIALVTEKKQVVAFIFEDGDLKKKVVLQSQRKSSPALEDWRGHRLKDLALFFNGKKYLVFDQNGLVFEGNVTQNLRFRVSGSTLLAQNEQNIFSLVINRSSL